MRPAALRHELLWRVPVMASVPVAAEIARLGGGEPSVTASRPWLATSGFVERVAAFRPAQESMPAC